MKILKIVFEINFISDDDNNGDDEPNNQDADESAQWSSDSEEVAD